MKDVMSEATTRPVRADLFRYVALDVGVDRLTGIFELDGRTFVEEVVFDGVDTLMTPAVTAVAELWFLLAGLSYYKAGAARRVDVGSTPLGDAGRALLVGALREGLGEFAYRNDLDLSDVEVVGGGDVHVVEVDLDLERVLVPFGGGIDSVVTVETLADQLDQTLFILSPVTGRFAPLEATAAVTGLDVVRATRQLDAQLLTGDRTIFNGHVPVTAMVTLLAAVAAVASGRGGVVMSNEHSSSVANLRWRDLDVNHQWSKSLDAEVLIADAIAERLGAGLRVASLLRDRSEVWVAEVFSQLSDYHHVFRSCNRAFTQVVDQRLDAWCGECDKCLFINLMLAPYLSRARLEEIFHHEPLSDVRREAQLRVLVGAGFDAKPFECVGDPGESAAALTRVAGLAEWHDVSNLAALAKEVSTTRTFDDLLKPQGASRVPAHWLR
jgi:UDP-N-acetyl-alpha-D-muramoyl-L-alanyl-L-glutamate epimerase